MAHILDLFWRPDIGGSSGFHSLQVTTERPLDRFWREGLMTRRTDLNSTPLTMTAARLESYLLKIVAKTFPSLIASNFLKNILVLVGVIEFTELFLVSSNKIPFKKVSYSKKINCTSGIFLQHHISKTQRWVHLTYWARHSHDPFLTWSLDCVYAHGPMCNHVSISDVLHDRQCQYQLKR